MIKYMKKLMTYTDDFKEKRCKQMREECDEGQSKKKCVRVCEYGVLVKFEQINDLWLENVSVDYKRCYWQTTLDLEWTLDTEFDTERERERQAIKKWFTAANCLNGWRCRECGWILDGGGRKLKQQKAGRTNCGRRWRRRDYQQTRCKQTIGVSSEGGCLSELSVTIFDFEDEWMNR